MRRYIRPIHGVNVLTKVELRGRRIAERTIQSPGAKAQDDNRKRHGEQQHQTTQIGSLHTGMGGVNGERKQTDNTYAENAAKPE